MSYATVTPNFYEMNFPETSWHAGSPGWSHAPFPGWGNNPNQAGPRRLGVGAYYSDPVLEPVSGLGCGCSAQGVGDDSKPFFPTWAWVMLGVAGVAIFTVNHLENKHHKSWYK